MRVESGQRVYRPFRFPQPHNRLRLSRRIRPNYTSEPPYTGPCAFECVMIIASHIMSIPKSYKMADWNT